MKLTDEQRSIADSVGAVLAAHASAAQRRTAIEQGAFDAALWRELSALGASCMHLAPEHGGLGLGLVELSVVAQALGQHLACVPWLESVLASMALAAVGGDEAARWLPRLASGEARGVMAWQAPHTPPMVQALASDGGWLLSGCIAALPGANDADFFLLPCLLSDGETALFLVPAITPQMTTQRVRNHDATRPLARVAFASAQLQAQACLLRGAPLQSLLETLMFRAAALLAAEQVGVAQACLDMSVACTQTRVQFGQPIARFQAIKHRCASTMVAVEVARSAVLGAALALDAGAMSDAALPWAATARHTSTLAAQGATQEAIQLHGGMGFTWECEAHWFFKRAQAASQWFGSAQQWMEVAAKLLTVPTPQVHSSEMSTIGSRFTQWMHEHLCGRFEPLRHSAGPGEAGFSAELAKAWEQALAQGGWVGLGWPKSHGGRALPLAEQVAVYEAYAHCGGPGRLGHIGEHLLAPTLMAHGTPEQQARFLPGILAGREYWAQGYSEPNAGSDLANVQTRARLVGNEWAIDGQKVWTSWAREADWIFVLARTEQSSSRHQGLSLLLVPLHQSGVLIKPIRQITGGSEFNEVFFDAARTEASLVLGGVGQGWKVAMALLGFERGVSTLGQQAHFEGELQTLVDVAQRSGAWLDAALRQRISAAALGLRALRCNALRVLDAAAGQSPPPEAMVAKYAWSNWRRDLGRLAADVLSAQSDVMDDNDPQAQRLRQLWLGSRADTIYAGSNEIQLNIIAERALGMPR